MNKRITNRSCATLRADALSAPQLKRYEQYMKNIFPHLYVPLLILICGLYAYTSLNMVIGMLAPNPDAIQDLKSFMQTQPLDAKQCGAKYVLDYEESMKEITSNLKIVIKYTLLYGTLFLFTFSAFREYKFYKCLINNS